MKSLKSVSLVFILLISLIQSYGQTPNPRKIVATFQIEDGVALIQWETQTETNTSYFILEKYVEGDGFKMFNKVKAAGHSLNPVKYEVEDYADVSVSYRVTLVSMDGQREVVMATTTKSGKIFTPQAPEIAETDDFALSY